VSRTQSVAASLNQSDTANIDGRVNLLNLFKELLGKLMSSADLKVTYSSADLKVTCSLSELVRYMSLGVLCFSCTAD
jgi:hypothetical protein